jgi:hypothetical protein
MHTSLAPTREQAPCLPQQSAQKKDVLLLSVLDSEGSRVYAQGRGDG